jgi:hypothetical protein
MRRIDCYPAERFEDSAQETMSDTENWLNWNGQMVDSNKSKDYCDADNESDIELGVGIKPLESPEHRFETATANILRLNHPFQRSMNQAVHGLITVSAMETRWNKGNKRK